MKLFPYHESSAADSAQNPSELRIGGHPPRVLKPGNQFLEGVSFEII
jgi:hypothetical protein